MASNERRRPVLEQGGTCLEKRDDDLVGASLDRDPNLEIGLPVAAVTLAVVVGALGCSGAESANGKRLELLAVQAYFDFVGIVESTNQLVNAAPELCPDEILTLYRGIRLAGSRS